MEIGSVGNGVTRGVKANRDRVRGRSRRQCEGCRREQQRHLLACEHDFRTVDTASRRAAGGARELLRPRRPAEIRSRGDTGTDTYYKQSVNLIDEGQFGAPIILTPFNYRYGKQYGVEFAGNYTTGDLSVYLNLAAQSARANRSTPRSSTSHQKISPSSPTTTFTSTTSSNIPPRVACFTPGTTCG